MKLSPPLARPFQMIVFDWDGTAVESRREDAAPLRGPIERLLRSEVLIVIVTGTNFRNIDGTFSSADRAAALKAVVREALCPTMVLRL